MQWGSCPIPMAIPTTSAIVRFTFLQELIIELNVTTVWSNFEIADMSFWRGEAYTKFFEYLDQQGGFYYERWGDAPFHSIAAALFASSDQIHFFDQIGYEHDPYTHCPRDEATWTEESCTCDPKRSFGAYFHSYYPYPLMLNMRFRL